jgi:uncharacterized protein (TIGR00730 family)
MKVAVYLGSRMGDGDQFRTAAESLGRAIAEAGAGLVYGGASIGLMSTVADAVLAAGGEVIGVMPRALVRREGARTDLTEMHVVESMHDRKALMAQLADAFITLPGGLGTLEELFEVWTWAQLGYHNKPCGLLNTDGFYDPLVAFIDNAVARGFLAAADRDLVKVERDVAPLLTWVIDEIRRRPAVERLSESALPLTPTSPPDR